MPLHVRHLVQNFAAMAMGSSYAGEGQHHLGRVAFFGVTYQGEGSTTVQLASSPGRQIALVAA
jgi:hypothetical protein